MRKEWLRKLGVLATVFPLTMASFVGCGGSDEAVQEENPDSINIMVWEGTFSEEAYAAFTEETGIEVNVSYIDNTDTLLAKMIEGSAEYDVIDLEAAYVQSFVAGELLAPLDKEAIPNISNVQDDLIATGPIGDEDGTYTVADIGPGYTSVIYNVETCPIEITSFEDLADPALEGEIAMVNSTISLYGAALEALGYSADSTDEAEIAEANDLLKEIKKNVKAFVGETAVSQLESGECSVAFCWDYMTLCNDSQENWDKFEIVDLDDGCEKFVQYYAIPASSTRQAAANEFINFMLSPEAQAMHAEEWGTAPSLKQEVMTTVLDASFYDNPGYAKYAELAENAWLVAVSDEQITLMDTYYTELMGGTE